jgi:hypothetical protein
MTLMLLMPTFNVIVYCMRCSGEHPYARVGANNVLDNTIYDLTLEYGNRDSVQ